MGKWTESIFRPLAVRHAAGRVRGGVDHFGMISKDADAIFVEGETGALQTAEAMAAAETAES